MKAEINWIIPDIMTNTSKKYWEEEPVCHKSPHFLDEKDYQLEWYLRIISQRDPYSILLNRNEKYDVILVVYFEQSDVSIIAATYFAVVSDEKKRSDPSNNFRKTDTRS